MRRAVIFAILAALVLAPACKRKKRPPPPEAAEEEVAEPAPSPSPKAPAPRPSAPSAAAATASPPVPPPPKKPVAGKLKDAYLIRSSEQRGKFPVPEGMRLLSRSSFNEVHEAPFTLKSLERFYKREMPRSTKIEARAFGFRVVGLERDGFVIVSQGPHDAMPRVSVILPPPARPLPEPGAERREH